MLVASLNEEKPGAFKLVIVMTGLHSLFAPCSDSSIAQVAVRLLFVAVDDADGVCVHDLHNAGLRPR
jgi:hypothetical protein